MSPNPPPRRLSAPAISRATLLLRTLPLVFLPFSLSLLTLLKALHTVQRRPQPRTPVSRQKVLLTGLPTPALLALARAFHAAGHTVIAAAPEPVRYTSPLRHSTAVSRFHDLPSPKPRDSSNTTQEHEILRIILAEQPALWIPLPTQSSTAEAEESSWVAEILRREAGSRRPRVRCQVFGASAEVGRLCGDEVAFAAFFEGLRTEMVGRRVVVVRSRAALHGVLNAERGGGRFVAERAISGEVDGEERAVMKKGEGLGLDLGEERKVVIPRETMNETYHLIAGLKISDSQPWLLKEDLRGELFVAHALVVDGAVKAFAVVRPVRQSGAGKEDDPDDFEDAVQDEPLETARVIVKPDDPAYEPLHGFVSAFVAKFTTQPSTHLSMAFSTKTDSTPTGTKTTLRPFACSTIPQPHLFQEADPSVVAGAYLSAGSQMSPSMPNVSEPRLSNGHTTPPQSPTPKSKKQGMNGQPASNGVLVSSAALLTPPSTPERPSTRRVDTAVLTSPSSAVGLPYYHQHFASRKQSITTGTASQQQQQHPKGIYALSTTVYLYLLLPLLALLRARSWGALKNLAKGVVLVLDRLVNWKEESWAWEDAGVKLWTWGVGGPVEAAAGLLRGAEERLRL